jgi:F-type H+-transporting ATPase subunit gamma
MRTRIGSVKSTQKITKAMHDGGRREASAWQRRPLKRASVCARMASVFASLAGRRFGTVRTKAARGTGSDQRHLVVVGEHRNRGLTAASIGDSWGGRLAREKIATLLCEQSEDRHGRAARRGIRFRRTTRRFVESFEVGIKTRASVCWRAISRRKSSISSTMANSMSSPWSIPPSSRW